MHVSKMSWAPLVLLFIALVGCEAPPRERVVAHEVERRILAPCCKRQTLEDHDSELARALRAEIERRAASGEPASAIEGDLARRYGEDVRAIPRGSNPRAWLGATVAIVLAIGGLALWRLLRRERMATGAPNSERAAGLPALDPDDEDRLDDELLTVD